MPTEVVKTIGSQPGDDYSTLAAWYADRKGNLVERDTIEVAELRGEDHDVGDGFWMDDSGVTVDENHYFVIRAMAGAEFKGDAGNLNGVARVKLERVYNEYDVWRSVITCSVPYTRFERFVVWGDVENGASGSAFASLDGLVCWDTAITCVANGLGIRLHCRCPNAYDGSAWAWGAYRLALVKNCVVYDIRTQATYSGAKGLSSCSYCYNNTVANIWGTAQAIGIEDCDTVKNNLVFNIAGAYGRTIAWSITEEDYNATDDGEGLGEHGIQIVGSNEVENTSPTDFYAKLKATAQCLDAGTDLAGTVDTDVFGTPRPQGGAFDIGAWEYIATSIVVKTIGSQPGDDYSTLAAWYADRKGNLVERDTIEVAELRGEDHDVGDGFWMDDSGVTVDENHYFVIRAMAGAEFKGDAGNLNGVARVKLEREVDGDFGEFIVIRCSVPYTGFERFVVWGDAENRDPIMYTNLYLYGLVCEPDAVACVANGLGVRARCRCPGGHGQAMGVGTVELVTNCVVYDLQAQAPSSYAGGLSSCSYCYNNTVANLSSSYQAHGIDWCDTVKNNLVFNIAGSSAYTIYSCTTVDYNATDDGEGLGEHGIQIVGSNEVENTSPTDFYAKLKATAQCLDAGTDLAGTVDTDVFGTPRPQGGAFDIGAWEYVEEQTGVTKIPWHLFFAGTSI